jgi:hypothetical protein
MPPAIDENALLAAVPRAKPYKLFPGCGGIYLEVKPSGAKYWRYRVRRSGINTTLSLGRFPETTIADALAERERIRAQSGAGLSPASVRRAEREVAKASKAPSFSVSLSPTGELTVIAGGQSLHLSARQAEVVRTALNAAAERGNP